MAEANPESAPEAAEGLEQSEFASLLEKEFRFKDDRQKENVETAVNTLAAQALQHTDLVSDDAIESINALVQAIDAKLTEQVNLILHHEDFQKLEGSWRGLSHLVNNTETDEQLKIRVMNISKKEVHKTLKRYKGTNWDQSPLFKKLYEEEYGVLGGEPYGCLIGDYEFSHHPDDVTTLQELSGVCASMHAPFIAASDPRLMNMDSWQELSDPRDLQKIFSTPDYAPWRSFRESEDSKYIVLRCLVSWRDSRTGPTRARSKNSTSEKTRPMRITPSTPGPTRRTRWV